MDAFEAMVLVAYSWNQSENMHAHIFRVTISGGSRGGSGGSLEPYQPSVFKYPMKMK